MKTLYERLGGSEPIIQVAGNIVDLHMNNPLIASRFSASNPARLKKTVSDFLITGTGGPALYKGKGIREAHRGMKLSASEFIAVLDDALEAMSKSGVGQREQEEMLFILYGMRSDLGIDLT